MVSAFVLTAVPEDALLCPLAAMELIAALVAESSATLLTVLLVLVLLVRATTDPAASWLEEVPLALPPEVLT
jgi:hypothetical protein